MSRIKRHKMKKEKPESSSNSRIQQEHDLAYYIHDRVELMHQVFSVLKWKEIKALAPECIRNVSSDDLQELCTEELLGISSKRLCAILDGGEPPTDTDSSSASPSPELETISLDSISSDDDVLSEASSKKKRHKHKRASKGKRRCGRGGLTVLELLELQARARAIRAQLHNEAVLKQASEPAAVQDHHSDNEVEIKEEPPEVVEISSDDEKPTAEELSAAVPSHSLADDVPTPSVATRANDIVITVPQTKTTRKIKLNRNKITVSMPVTDTNKTDDSPKTTDKRTPTKNNTEQTNKANGNPKTTDKPNPTKNTNKTKDKIVPTKKTTEQTNKLNPKTVDKRVTRDKQRKRKKNIKNDKEGSDYDEITLQLSDSEKMDLLEYDETRQESSVDSESSSDTDTDDDDLKDTGSVDKGDEMTIVSSDTDRADNIANMEMIGDEIDVNNAKDLVYVKEHGMSIKQIVCGDEDITAKTPVSIKNKHDMFSKEVDDVDNTKDMLSMKEHGIPDTQLLCDGKQDGGRKQPANDRMFNTVATSNDNKIFNSTDDNDTIVNDELSNLTKNFDVVEENIASTNNLIDKEVTLQECRGDLHTGDVERAVETESDRKVVSTVNDLTVTASIGDNACRNKDTDRTVTDNVIISADVTERCMSLTENSSANQKSTTLKSEGEVSDAESSEVATIEPEVVHVGKLKKRRKEKKRNRAPKEITEEIFELSDDSSCYEVAGTVLSKEPTAEQIEALSAKIDEIEQEEKTEETAEVDNVSWKDRYLESSKVKRVMSTSNILNALRKKNRELKKRLEETKTVEAPRESATEESLPAQEKEGGLEEGSIKHYNTLSGSTKYVDPVKDPAESEGRVTKEMKRDAKQLLRMYKKLLKYNDMNRQRDPTKKKKKSKKSKGRDKSERSVAVTQN